MRVNQYEQSVLPSGKGGSSYSLGGEKRSPVLAPRTQEQVWVEASKQAQAVTNIGMDMIETRNANEIMNALNAADEFDGKLRDKFDDPTFRQNTHYDNYENIHKDDYTKITNELVKNFKGTPHAKEILLSKLKEREIDSRNYVLALSNKRERDNFQSDYYNRYDNYVSKYEGLVNIDPSTLSEEQLADIENRKVQLLSDLEADTKAMVAGKVITPEQGRAMLNNFNDGATTVEESMRIDRAVEIAENEKDPHSIDKAIAVLKDIHQDYQEPIQGMDGKTRVYLSRYVKQKIKTLKVEKERRAEEANKVTALELGRLQRDRERANASSMFNRRLDTEHVAKAQSVLGGKPEKLAAYLEDYYIDGERNVQIGIYLDMEKSASPAEEVNLDKRIEELKTKDPVLAAKLLPIIGEVRKKKRTMLEKDPAAYVKSYLPKASISDIIIEQERLGVKPYNIQALTDAEADSINKGLTNLAPEEASKELFLFKEMPEYKDNWSIIVKDLYDAGMPYEYAVAAGLEKNTQTSVATDLIEIAKVDEKTLLTSTASDKYDEKELKSYIDDDIDDQFRNFSKAISGALDFRAESDVEINKQKTILRKLALKFIQKGVHPDDAVGKAIDELFGRKFDVHSDGAYVVPKSTNLTIDDVEDVNMFYQNKITGSDIENPVSPNGNKLYRNKEELERAATIIRSQGEWRDDPNYDGLVLKVGGEIVYKADGTPHRLSWAEYHKIKNEEDIKGIKKSADKMKVKGYKGGK